MYCVFYAFVDQPVTKPTMDSRTIVISCTAVFFLISSVTVVVVIIVLCIVFKKKSKRRKQEDVPVYESVELPPSAEPVNRFKNNWTSTKAQQFDDNYYDEVKIISENENQFELTENEAYSSFKLPPESESPT